MIEGAVAEPLEAREPPEVRGADRAEVALLVARRHDGALVHARFDELGRFLRAGDLLVVNTSATLPAALPARLQGRDVLLHLSTQVGHGDGTTESDWVVELRTTDLLPFRAPRDAALASSCPGGAEAELLAPYLGSSRLSFARLSLGEPLEDYLAPPRRTRSAYAHSPRRWPIDAYQTSSGSTRAAPRCRARRGRSPPSWWRSSRPRGVLFAPVTLHAGVSSLELGESPYPERYRVSGRRPRGS